MSDPEKQVIAPVIHLFLFLFFPVLLLFLPANRIGNAGYGFTMRKSRRQRIADRMIYPGWIYGNSPERRRTSPSRASSDNALGVFDLPLDDRGRDGEFVGDRHDIAAVAAHRAYLVDGC